MKLTEEQKQANKLARQKAKKETEELAKIEREKNQKPIKEITINIEWKKSRTWGHNPHCEARIHFQDGSWERSPVYTASGCGYDKESTVIANVFNAYLKYKLYNEDLEKNEHKPYGFYCTKDWKSYNGGVGTSCYYRIAEAIGGKFEHVASGKTFDVYKYTDNEKEL